MITIDACSIILLAKSTVLEEFTKQKKIIISEGVYKEVREGKKKKLLNAILTEKLVEEKKIIVKKNVNRELLQKITSDFGLGAGEAETIVLALETDDKIVITDNKQGRKAAKIYGLQLAGSIGVVISLFKTKKISKEKAVNALKLLKNTGWFQDYLIEEALRDIKNG